MGSQGSAPSYHEVWGPRGVQVVLLHMERLTIGRSDGNDIVLERDRTASSLHAVVESYGPGWALRDLGSTNGTFVGGERLLGERVLRHNDELRIGQTRITFRAGVAGDITGTTSPKAPPELTRRERDTLLALCRPLYEGDVFREPASVRDVAEALFVTQAAVKQHLLRLYDKFEIEPSPRRRLELANDAIRRGAISPAELSES